MVSDVYTGSAALPGDSVPLIVVVANGGSTKPVPLRVPPLRTETAEVSAIDPSTSRMPSLTSSSWW